MPSRNDQRQPPSSSAPRRSAVDLAEVKAEKTNRDPARPKCDDARDQRRRRHRAAQRRRQQTTRSRSSRSMVLHRCGSRRRGKSTIRRLDVPGDARRSIWAAPSRRDASSTSPARTSPSRPVASTVPHVQIIADRVRVDALARPGATPSSAVCCGWNRRAGPSRLRIRRSTRNRMVVAAIALVCAAASVSPVARPIRGLSLDILTALRWEIFGHRHDPRLRRQWSSRSTRKACAPRR